MEEMNDLKATKCSLRQSEKRVLVLTELKEEEIRQREWATRNLNEARVELNLAGKEVEELKTQLKGLSEMKVIAGCLLALLCAKTNLTIGNIKTILTAVGAEADEDRLQLLLNEYQDDD